MSEVAIITGDIVGSTSMSLAERERCILMLERLPQTIASISKFEMYRGDGFQLEVDNIAASLRVAVAIRAFLRSYGYENSRRQYDARLSLGVGSVDYLMESLAISDGEAFRLSGRGLDSIGDSRLVVETPWEDVNDELKVSTAFADSLISSWTRSQSRIMFQYLISNMTTGEIGLAIGVSQQMASKGLKTAEKHLIDLYVDRFVQLIDKHTL